MKWVTAIFYRFLPIVLILSLFLHLFAAASGAEIKEITKEPSQISGAQVFVLDPSYENDLGAFFKEAKAKGINTVFLRVFHNLGDRTHFHIPADCQAGVYFQTDKACVIGDVLKDAVKVAHENNIKIFAWMATRSLSFLKTQGNLSQSFLASGGVSEGYGADIFNMQVRGAIVGLFGDLAAYDIDGILLQDDFIFKYTEGADPYSSKLFEEETGLKAAPDTFFRGIKVYDGKETFTGFKDEFYLWADWKNYHLMQLFREIRDKALSANPQIMFAANVYYETPIAPKEALAWYSQKLDALDRAGFDYYAVMGYSEQIGMEKRLDDKAVAEYIGNIAVAAAKNAQNPAKVIIKLQSRRFFGDKGEISDKDFKNLCQSIEKAGGVGVIAVPVFSGRDIKTCDFNKE